MARGDRPIHAGQAEYGSAHAHGQAAQASLTEEQRAALDTLLGALGPLARALRAAQHDGREAISGQLSRVADEAEPVALAFATHLGTVRGPSATDAADVATAMGELEPRKEVAREARRARLRLRSAGIAPQLVVPLVADRLLAARPISTLDGTGAVTPRRGWLERLAEAHVTRSRESGEVSLILGWQEGSNPDQLRGTLLALDFWHEGVRDAGTTETKGRQRFLRETIEQLRSSSGVATVPITWAQARQLVEEALAVATWRDAELPATFTQLRAQLDERLLGEPTDEVQRTAITEEQARFAREGDRPYIGADLTADETVANWIGAWSMGDYGLAYDLLADTNLLRRGQTRDEFVALRRQWAAEAKPAALRLALVREQEQRASALWVPGSTDLAAGGSKDIEAFWSLQVDDSPIGGQLDELPMATLISAATSRHWYWTAYSLTHDRGANLWLISRVRDEGAASQALTIEELQTRLKETRDAGEKLAQSAPQNPSREQSMELVRTLTGTIESALHYDDALIAKLPLDETAYRGALDDARLLSNHERAAALLERMMVRLGESIRRRFELGIEQYMAAEVAGTQGQAEAATQWLDRAIATLTRVAEDDRTAQHLQALGELLARRGRLDQAEACLREAIALDPSVATLHADLASVLVARATGENLEEVAPPSAAAQRDVAQAALTELREAARLDRSVPHLFTRMGAVYDLLGQHEDARIAFDQAVKSDPGDAEATYALGALLLADRQPEQARPHLERAVELEPLGVAFRLALASCYVALNRLREAERELSLIDRLQPNLPQVAELRTIIAQQQKHK